MPTSTSQLRIVAEEAANLCATAWFKEALATATVQTIVLPPLKLISPVAFLATKHVAFMDRGKSAPAYAA